MPKKHDNIFINLEEVIMKKCPNCDGELRDDADVCQYCGQTVPLKSVLVIMDQPQETKTEKETPVVSSPTTNGLSKAEHE